MRLQALIVFSPEVDGKEIPESLVVATSYYLDKPADGDFVDYFEHKVKPILYDSGASALAYFVTDSTTNNFPALPVREGENVFIWFSRFQNQAAYEDQLVARANSPHWRTKNLGRACASLS